MTYFAAHMIESYVVLNRQPVDPEDDTRTVESSYRVLPDEAE